MSKVGYRKPPKDHQFKPKTSGNPKGRPRGQKNLKTDLMDELSERIAITEAGAPKRITKQRAYLKGLVARAITNDRAANILANLMLRLMDETDTPKPETPLAAEDQALLDRYVASFNSGASDDKP